MYSVGIIKVMWPFLSEMGAVLALPVVDQYLRERDDCFLTEMVPLCRSYKSHIMVTEHIKHGNWNNES